MQLLILLPRLYLPEGTSSGNMILKRERVAASGDIKVQMLLPMSIDEEAKVVAAGWGDVFECRTNLLAARMIGRKVFG